ncbi:OmpA family protein [Serratia fonticola]|jgi:outer membrane lipoprotein SlyB|uniref:OmpA family protein n=1 Tax=Serratia fonticola TaxID=47917 RepID=A0A542BPU8_SERFO|nr:glycine zipper family protein [Serratia fonticola]TQI80608.1 OmpA family protein [Serratia fonticola]TQI97367.1 OmpA family protein [Serratia fonticola]TVZ71863.1 OmpA family protein [Serratia fonticola]
MKRKLLSAASLFTCCALLAGCASAPTGPNVTVLPGDGKSYEQFNRDDAICRNNAQNSIGSGVQAASNNTVGTAAAGTVLGAAAGALIGAATGNAGAGAAIGAGSGLLIGSAVGSNAGLRSAGSLQQQYDVAYTQCMYARGDQIPATYDYRQMDDRSVPPDYSPAPDNSVPPDYVPR